MHYHPTRMDYDGPALDPDWQDALDALAPPADRMASLHLVWESGDPWFIEDSDDMGIWRDGSVHRWVVYQMLPPERTPVLVLGDLNGPSPRMRGRYDRYLEEPRFIPDPHCNISQRQWLLYHETGRYGVPYWIVQGSRGGHKRRWNRIESVISRMHGGPKEPPLAGELPYAPFDNRVIHQLAKLDRVRHASYLLERSQRSLHHWQQHERELLAQLKDEIWDRWLADQVRDAMSLAPRQALADFTYALPRTG
jgi:hypothetical protein